MGEMLVPDRFDVLSRVSVLVSLAISLLPHVYATGVWYRIIQYRGMQQVKQTYLDIDDLAQHARINNLLHSLVIWAVPEDWVHLGQRNSFQDIEAR